MGTDTRQTDGWVAALQAATDWLCVYYSIFLIITGCVCNLLSFAVFSRARFRKTTVSVYLRLLALSDLTITLNGFLPYVSLRGFGRNLRADDMSCQISMFFHFFLLYFSSWTLVIVTAERVVAVRWPHRLQAIRCAPSDVKLFPVFGLFLCLFGGISLLCSFQFKDMTMRDPSTNQTRILDCVSFDIQDSSLDIYMADSLLFAVLPSLLLLVSNFLIIQGVIKSRNRVAKMSQNRNTVHQSENQAHLRSIVTESPRNTGSTDYDKDTLIGCTSRTSSKPQNDFIGRKVPAGRSKRLLSKEVSLALMLVAVSSTFIVCNCPICAFGFWVSFVVSVGPVEVALNDILVVLMFTNNNLNFLLYCLTGTRFRAELTNIFKDLVNLSRSYVCKSRR